MECCCKREPVTNQFNENNQNEKGRHLTLLETLGYYFIDLFDRFLAKVATALIISISFIKGNVDKSIYLLWCLIIIDLITGLIKGLKNKNLSSYKAGQGIVKIFLLFTLIVTGIILDHFFFGCKPHYGFTYIILSYSIVHVSISVLENLSELGLPVPKGLIKFLRTTKDTLDADIPEGVKKIYTNNRKCDNDKVKGDY